jgi:hypothetical protein
MSRLLTRLRRIERALRTGEPRDPRRDLPDQDVRRALDVLDGLGAEPSKALAPGEGEWFERTIRPRLRLWAAYDRRQQEWRALQAARVYAATQRKLARNGGWRSQSVFSDTVRRAFGRLGLVPAPG